MPKPGFDRIWRSQPNPLIQAPVLGQINHRCGERTGPRGSHGSRLFSFGSRFCPALAGRAAGVGPRRSGLNGGPPSGTFRPQRLERMWHSRTYDWSPMPHSIFFHHGFAIHGTNYVSRLGRPASHGCVRLHPSNAAMLVALVKERGMGRTTIAISDFSPRMAYR